MNKIETSLFLPYVGYGTCEIRDGKLIVDALKSGYRLIDTAAHYFNEVEVGDGIRDSGIPREEIMLTSKLWYDNMSCEGAVKACEESLDRLGVDYLDLYLIHWPAAEPRYPAWKEVNADVWKGMERLVRSGKVRAIGTCNFMVKHMEALLESCEIRPFVNQIECHPGFYQRWITEYCLERDIHLMGWGPLGTGEVLKSQTIVELGKKYNRTPAQICLKWSVQHGYIVIPKSSSVERMKENLDIDEFDICDEDMERIDNMEPCGGQCAVVK